jgi:molybdopterin molybdotransferase
MITLEEAYEIVMGQVRSTGTEKVPVGTSLGRVLAEEVKSDMNMPPFDKSAMDGYACRREDLGGELTVLETIPAGRPPTKSIGPGQCSKIMTGAMVPEGADCVIMVEFTEQPTPETVRYTGKPMRDNICFEGEDVKNGDVVLLAGDVIFPQHVAVLTSVGCVGPLVARKPRVGIIATGDELVEPSVSPGVSQIRNSNSYQLSAQAEQMGAAPTYYGIAEDTEAGISGAIRSAMAESDVVVVSGGVSAGDFDIVPAMLKKSGFELLFEKVAIKPGKPTVFGRGGKAVCFGMPGNPVSTFVIFELLVKPFLYKMMGCDWKPRMVPMKLKDPISRKNAKRASWVPVTTTADGVMPCEYHGSAHVSSLCGADGLVCIPAGVNALEKGSKVDVRQL